MGKMTISRHTAINFVGSVAPIAVTVITVPLYLRTIGTERYGALVVIWLITSYLGLFDFGVGKSLTKALSRTNQSEGEHHQLIRSGVTLGLMTGLIGALLSGPVIHWYLNHGMKTSDTLKDELANGMLWVAMCIPIAAVTSICIGVLESRHRFKEIVVCNMIGGLLTQLAPLLVAIILKPDLNAMIPFVTLGRLLTLTMLLTKVARTEQHIVKDFSSVRLSAQVKGLLQFGGWVTVSNLITPVLIGADKLVLTATASLQATAQYNVAFSMASVIALIPNSLSAALFPRLAASTDPHVGRAVVNRALSALSLVITPLVILGVSCSPMVLHVWLGSAFSDAARTPVQVLMLAMWPHALAYIPYARLHANGQPRAVALSHTAQLAPYLAALVWLLPHYGMLGAAAAWTGRAALDAAALFAMAKSLVTVPKRLASDAMWALSSFLIAAALTDKLILAILGVLLAAAYVTTNRHSISRHLRHG